MSQSGSDFPQKTSGFNYEELSGWVDQTQLITASHIEALEASLNRLEEYLDLILADDEIREKIFYIFIDVMKRLDLHEEIDPLRSLFEDGNSESKSKTFNKAHEIILNAAKHHKANYNFNQFLEKKDSDRKNTLERITKLIDKKDKTKSFITILKLEYHAHPKGRLGGAIKKYLNTTGENLKLPSPTTKQNTLALDLLSYINKQELSWFYRLHLKPENYDKRLQKAAEFAYQSASAGSFSDLLKLKTDIDEYRKTDKDKYSTILSMLKEMSEEIGKLDKRINKGDDDPQELFNFCKDHLKNIETTEKDSLIKNLRIILDSDSHEKDEATKCIEMRWLIKNTKHDIGQKPKGKPGFFHRGDPLREALVTLQKDLNGKVFKTLDVEISSDYTYKP